MPQQQHHYTVLFTSWPHPLHNTLQYNDSKVLRYKHRAWFSPSVSWISKKIQWNSNDLGIVRVHYRTPRYFYYYCYWGIKFKLMLAKNKH
jgi:hypothetical protein